MASKRTNEDAAPAPTQVAIVAKDRRAALTVLVREFKLADGKVIGLKSGVGRVRLSHRAGQIAVWGKDGDETVTITADGYSECNRVACVSVMTPADVVVRGAVVPNPAHDFDDRGSYLGSTIRKVAVAPGPLGSWSFVDRTLYFSVRAYFVEALSAIAKRNPLAVVLGVRDINPADVLADVAADANAEIDRKVAEDAQKWGWLKKTRTSPEDVARAVAKAKRGTWRFIEWGPEGLGYWIDYGSAAVAQVAHDYARSQKFDARKAESIAERNVLRRHPLMPAMKCSPTVLRPLLDAGTGEMIDRYVEVPVYFYAMEGEREALEKAFRDYDAGIRTGAFHVDADGAPEVATDEDPEFHGNDDEAPPTKVAEDPEVAEPKDQEPKRAPDADAALRSRMHQTEEIAGPDLVREVLKTFPNLVDPKARERADALVLASYTTALNAAINRRDQAAPPRRQTR